MPSEDELLPRVVGAADITAEQRDADLWVTEAAREALPRLRELAGQWAATVTTLTGLFGLGALISGDDAVRALDTRWRVAYGVLALVALTAAAVSILQASLAAQATVAEVGPDVSARVAERRERIQAVRRRLAISRWAAGVALVMAVLALAVRWYAPL